MASKIPLVDLAEQHGPIRAKLIAAFTRCLDRNRFILGPEVERFEAAIAEYCGVRFAIGVSSGTDALLATAMALGIAGGDEVVTSPYSFFATAGVIARLGATPVFSEVDASTLNLDPMRLEERLTEKTKAIIPVHLFGKLADMEPILEIAERWGIPVVEDAAQAIGASDDKGRMAGSVGTAGTLSFYPSKNLAALGDAGMVLTNETGLSESVRRIRTHGGTEEYFHDTVGGNFRLDAVQAALLEVKLECLDEWTRMRRERAASYDELFDRSGLVTEGKVQPPQATADHVYHKYVIRTRRRDELKEHLASNGIGTAVYYPLPLHLQPCFRELGYGEGSFPVAEAGAKETLAIPMYPELTQNQQEHVVAQIVEFFRG